MPDLDALQQADASVAKLFETPVVGLAQRLVGSFLVRRTRLGWVGGRIVETEAYRGPEDQAAHSRNGRRTPRTEVMFGPAGHAYMFFVYGMHWNFNVVAGPRGRPHAVLIRALEPLWGLQQMSRRRGLEPEDAALTNGPGKLCQALGLDGSHYGCDLSEGELRVLPGAKVRVSRSPRVGIDYAGEWAARPWRFCDPASRYLSRAPRERGRLGRT
ncbi:MAG: DNA-3-methyladenine glycosylase [Polyangiaceae bacterium]